MTLVRSRRPAWALLAVAGSLAVTTACSAGSLRGGGDSADSGGKVALTFLVDNGDNTVKMANQVVKDFTAANPNITVTVDTRPGGTDGDNLVKTRLSTGDMSDVFMYNSGSLFQAIKPQQNLVPLTSESWVGSLEPAFKSTVSTSDGTYGAPWGSFASGAILYNRKVYDKLGLQVPKTWDEFMKNNAAIKKAGVDPVIQTYGDTWTSQLFVLGDFHNVAANDPQWAEKYTANQVKYATDPTALAGFEHLQEVHDAGYVNKDFGSAKLNDGLTKLGQGKGAHYPMLSGTLPQLYDLVPSSKQDVGVFPIPGSDASSNGLTVWSPAGVYIPKTTTGAKLDAAKKLAAFIASPAGCDSQTKAALPTGPYAVKECKLPSDVPQAITDQQNYFNRPKGTSPALEFLSPVKGPSLEQITVEVGSGIRPAKAGAQRYDEDVKKQAQQLGLEGW